MQTATLTLPNGRALTYRIRLSKRAKYMRLTFSASKGLVVTQPAGACKHALAAWVHSKRDWISQHAERIAAYQQANEQTAIPERPAQIDIPLLQQTLQVDYRPANDSRITMDYDGKHILTLSGATGNTELCLYALQKWMQQYAKLPLIKLLEQTAAATGFSYNNVRIKAQRTRWGSCSSKGNINLNYKLALMPEHWARYTVTHELCHTIELNHSKRFWGLVARHIPDYQTIHEDMKQADKVLPSWVNYEYR